MFLLDARMATTRRPTAVPPGAGAGVAGARPDPAAFRALGHDGFEEESRAEVADAVEFARASPFPSPDLTTTLVYA
jgi:hypothetical protein